METRDLSSGRQVVPATASNQQYKATFESGDGLSILTSCVAIRRRPLVTKKLTPRRRWFIMRPRASSPSHRPGATRRPNSVELRSANSHSIRSPGIAAVLKDPRPPKAFDLLRAHRTPAQYADENGAPESLWPGTFRRGRIFESDRRHRAALETMCVIRASSALRRFDYVLRSSAMIRRKARVAAAPQPSRADGCIPWLRGNLLPEGRRRRLRFDQRLRGVTPGSSSRTARPARIREQERTFLGDVRVSAPVARGRREIRLCRCSSRSVDVAQPSTETQLRWACPMLSATLARTRRVDFGARANRAETSVRHQTRSPGGSTSSRCTSARPQTN